MSGVRISDGSPFDYLITKRIHIYGEVSEWFKELVLKTSDSERDRGFESHPLRQESFSYSFWRSTQEAEEDGLLNR